VLQLPVLVVLDEAYIEFSDVPSCMPWVASRHNLIVLRTFSKSAGEAPCLVPSLARCGPCWRHLHAPVVLPSGCMPSYLALLLLLFIQPTRNAAPGQCLMLQSRCGIAGILIRK
jgi:hypothetical protein